jgi:hypothetical protein
MEDPAQKEAEMWLLLMGEVLAQDRAGMSGRWCDSAGRCKTYTVDLYRDGTLRDSLGRRGTYTLKGSGTRRELRYQIGSLTNLAYEGSQDCWVEASPPLNPALGSINVCLGVALQELSHYDPECETNTIGVVAPAAAEAGHWAAGRFSPGGGGMWVHELEYHLQNEPTFEDCSALDHRVQVFVGPADEAPPGSPTVLHEFDLAGASLVAGSNTVVVELPAPLFVASDESVFLSVEMVREADGDRLCQFVCGEGQPFVGDTSFWSNSALTPYPWQDLNDFGIGELMVVARGIYAAP